MFGWFGGVWRVAKTLLGPVTNIVQDYFSYRSTKSRLEFELLEEVVRADIKNRMLRKELLLKEMEWAPFRWLRFFVFFSLVFYYIAVIGDSIFHFSFDVSVLPSSVKHLVDEWAGWIISYFCLAGGQSILGIINRWVFKR